MNCLPFGGVSSILRFAFAANINLRLQQRQHCVCRKRRLMFAANEKNGSTSAVGPFVRIC